AAQEHGETSLRYIHSDGEVSTQTYSELWVEAQRILGGLRELGLKPQAQVIFQLESNQDFISAFWGCVLGGFVPVPITVATSYQTNNAVNKLHYAWQRLEQPLVLTDVKLISQIKSLSGLLNLDELQVITIDELRKCELGQNLYSSQQDDLALIMLTSGSTGMSKGVMLTHKNLLSRTIGSVQRNNFSTEDITLNWMSLDHVAGLIYFHIRDVYLGCKQIHASSHLVIENPLQWLNWIDQFGVTITFAPNFAFSLVNNCVQNIEQGNWDLSSIRFILNGAEQIVAATSRRFLKLLSPYGLSSTAIYPAWGMAEVSSGITYNDNFSLESTTDDDSFVTVGLPIPGVSLKIVDNQNQIVAEGEIGSLQVKGLTVTSGYYQNPTANQEAFTADGWFNTGDLGFLKNGCLTITGRQKDVIIIN
ncbi:MAG: AMP-binding protein, partial [Trichodesmium sp. St4_bin8_1]|nr:AMP-binding protein [Trichodesmium sp. St4_bin8_1]